MNNPKVSIIINCYNGEEYLKDAINSIYAQTYNNWEIIFWDNNSTDSSAEIANSFDSRLKYFKGNTTVPLYAARNLAIENSTGSLIAFLDCDDWWGKDKLIKQVQEFEYKEIGFCFSDYWIENESNGKRSLCQQKLRSSEYILDDLLKSYTIGLLTLMIRKETYNQLKEGFNPDFNIIGDFDLVIRLSSISKSSYLTAALAHYRYHSTNLSIKDPMRNISELETWHQDIKKDVTISNSKEFYNIPIIIHYSKMMYLMKNKQKKEALRGLLKIPINRKEFLRLVMVFFLPKVVIDYLAR